MNHLRSSALLILILLAGIVSRCYRIDFQSLWLDELYTMKMADPRLSLADIYKASGDTDPLSIFYFTTLHFCFKVFGYTSVVARLYSAFFGVLGVLFTWLLGKELFNKRVGLIAALVLCLNPFHLSYSQEARVYTMYLAASALSYYCLVRYCRSPDFRKAILYALATLWMILSHKFGLFTLVAQALILITAFFYYKPSVRLSLLHALVVILILVVGYIPEIFIVLRLSDSSSTWIQQPGMNTFPEIYGQFFSGSYMILSLTVLSFLYFVFRVFSRTDGHPEGRRDTQAFILLSSWIIITYMFPYILSFVKVPMLHSRYLVNLLPAFCILTAAGFSVIRSAAARSTVLVVLCLVTICETLFVMKYYSHFRKSDFRGAADFVADHNSMGADVYTSLSFQFSYYFDKPENRQPLQPVPAEAKLNSFRGGEPHAPFWALDAHGRSIGLSDSNSVYLEKHFIPEFRYWSVDAWASLYIPKTGEEADAELELDADNFSDSVTAGDDKRIYLFNSDPVSSRLLTLKEGNFKMVVQAQSKPARAINGMHGRLRILNNGEKAAEYYLRKDSYLKGDTISFKSNGEPFRLTLQLMNDTNQGRRDRNIVVRKIRFYRENP